MGGGRLKHGRPALARILRLEETAFGARPPNVAHDRHVGRVGVGRVDHDARDHLAVPEPGVGPGGAPVGRAVDPVTPARAVAVVGLAGADPDDLRVGGRHRHRADGGHGFLLEDRLEGPAVVGGLHEPPGGEAHVESERILGVVGHVRDSPAHHRRPDAPGLERRQGHGVDSRSGRLYRPRGRRLRAGGLRAERAGGNQEGKDRRGLSHEMDIITRAILGPRKGAEEGTR